MIVSTRFRDIPFEEIKCIVYNAFFHMNPRDGWRKWERDYRGKPVKIITPPVEIPRANCTGPFYMLVEDPEQSVCEHIVEIGD